MNFSNRLFKSLILFGLAFSLVSLSLSASGLDSLRTERVGDKAYIIHQVEAKETLFAISRRYKASVGEIVQENESLKGGLKIGQEIRIPFVEKAKLPEDAVLHNIIPGETLFSVSKKYGVSVDDLKEWNDLKGNDLSVGQDLVIKEQHSDAENASNPDPESTPSKTLPSKLEDLKEDLEKDGQVLEEKGKAKAKKEGDQAEKKVKEQPEKTKKAVDKQAQEVKEKEEELKENVAEKKETVESLGEDAVPIVPGDWISHTVQSGETLFSISKRYNASVEDLIRWNGLTSNNVKQGQVLKVGREQAGPSTLPVVGQPRVVKNQEEMHDVPVAASTGGFQNISEIGQAEVIPGTGGHQKYLVLHRKAAVGTIMRVRNEENGITVFARVVGVLPDTGDNSKLLIKISQAAFEQLKAVNSRFPVEVTY